MRGSSARPLARSEMVEGGSVGGEVAGGVEALVLGGGVGVEFALRA